MNQPITDDPIPQGASMMPGRSDLVFPGDDGRLIYKPYTDRGDRILNYSRCGYKRSEEPIPDIPAVEILMPSDGDVISDGTMAYPLGPDSRVQIQAALDSVANRQPDDDGFRGAVLLTKGTWHVHGSLIVASGVVLRGEGDETNGTVLVIRNPQGTGINLGTPEATIEPLGHRVDIIDSYIPAGGRKLTVEDSSQFSAGDFIEITKTVNDTWIKDLGMDKLAEIRPNRPGDKKVRNWEADAYQFKHIRQISQVNERTLVLDVMLPQSFALEHGGGTVQKVSLDTVHSLCGVESLRVVSNYDTAPIAVRNDIEYFCDEEANLFSGIDINCIDGWARDCTVLHTRFSAVRVNGPSIYSTVRDCRSFQPVSMHRGGRRYAFCVGGGSYALFYNCYSEGGRHDFVAGSRVMGPHAFVNCKAFKSSCTSEPHHRWGCGILFDSICLKEGGSLAALNRGDSGTGHGWAAANTVFWNSDAAEVVVMGPPTSENNFAIGYRGEARESHSTNLLNWSNTRSGYAGTPKEAEYNGFALMGTGYIEHPDRPVEPKSLFVQQLVDRIGEDRAEAVLK